MKLHRLPFCLCGSFSLSPSSSVKGLQQHQGSNSYHLLMLFTAFPPGKGGFISQIFIGCPPLSKVLESFFVWEFIYLRYNSSYFDFSYSSSFYHQSKPTLLNEQKEDWNTTISINPGGIKYLFNCFIIFTTQKIKTRVLQRHSSHTKKQCFSARQNGLWTIFPRSRRWMQQKGIMLLKGR